MDTQHDNKQPRDEATIDERPYDEAAVDEWPRDEMTIDEQPYDEATIDEQPCDETTTDKQPCDATTIDEKPCNEATTDERPHDEATTNERPYKPDDMALSDEACNSDTYALCAQGIELRQGTRLNGNRDGYIPALPVLPGELESERPKWRPGQGGDDPSNTTNGSQGDDCHPKAAAKPKPTVWQ